MKHAGSLLVGLFLLGVGPASGAGSDGIWTLRERFCVSVNAKRQCGRGSEQLMFLEGIAYYREAPDAPWGELGAVSTSRHRITVRASREGFGGFVSGHLGFDVTDLLQNFSLVYSGRLGRGQITNGHVRASVDISSEELTYRIRIAGPFTGRLVGDAYPVPPPDPDPDPVPEVESEMDSTPAVSPVAGSAPSMGAAVAAALRSVEGVRREP